MRPSSLCLAASLAVLLASSTHAQAPSDAPPACVNTPEPELKGKHLAAYLTDSESQLKNEVYALHGIKFAKGAGAAEAEPVLKQTGDIIAAMLPRIPRLVANEDLVQTMLPLPYTVEETSTTGSSTNKRNPAASMSSETRAVEGEDLAKALHGKLVAQTRINRFSYRIQTSATPTGSVIDEFRTDSTDAAVDVTANRPGNPQGVGFGNAWLQFVPVNQPQSQFRLLGTQKIDGHDTTVLAFAQVPGKVTLPAAIAIGGNACSFYTQGIVWIDRTSSEIVRLQTDLLTPLSGIHLVQMRSEIRFDDIRIAEKNLSLTMPTNVEISWMTPTQAGGELHKYSNYRLYNATSRIITNPVN